MKIKKISICLLVLFSSTYLRAETNKQTKDYSEQSLVLKARYMDLSGANFTSTYLLPGSIFANANLVGANLTDADFSNQDLSGANLTNAILDGTVFTGSRFSSTTKWPKGFDHLNAGIHGPGVDYTDQSLKLNARYLDLSGANFTRAYLLPGSIFANSNLVGANLTNADFSNQDLSGANLTNAVLDGTNFSNARFNENTDLKGAAYNSFTIWPDGFDPISAGAIINSTLDRPSILPTAPEISGLTPPDPDYKDTIAELMRLLAEKDKKLAHCEKEIEVLNEEVTGLGKQVTSLDTNNKELKKQIQNLREDNQNLNYEITVTNEHLEKAIQVAETPFINGWVYDPERGWLFTDADRFPLIYTHKDQTWHYYELGSSNPRYFFNYKTQEWVAWDAIPVESDQVVANNNNL